MGNTPKKLYLYEVDQGDYIVPYGFISSLQAFLTNNDIKHSIVDETQNRELKMIEKEKLSLYPWQEIVVDKVLIHNNGILVSPTGSGKTRMAMGIIGKRNVKTLWITNKLDLLRQSKNAFKTFFKNKAGQISGGKVNIQDVTFATVQTLNKLDLEHYKDTWDMIIVDECFSGDTEILTDKGFISFKDLKNENVAQYNNDGSINFVQPLRKIEKNYSGEMVDMKIHRDASVLMTPNHRQVFRNNKYEIKESLAKDVKRGRLIVSGKAVGEQKELTDFEKLLILTQADAYKTVSHTNQYQISLTKKRKINRFLDIVSKLDIDIKLKEVKGRENSRRFTYYLPIGIEPKILSNVFNLIDFSYEKAKSFIYEVSFWDGYINKKGLNTNYDSRVKENVDFVSAVATLGGYKNYMIKRVDNRSPKFSDIYRVFFLEQETKSVQEQKQTIEIIKDYNDKVYCVEVPSGMIVVRSGGHTFVSGNCHRAIGTPTMVSQFSRILNGLNAKYKYGLTATLFNRKNKISMSPIFLIGEKLYEVESKYIDRVTAKHVKVDLNTPESAEYLGDDKTVDFAKQIAYLVNNNNRNLNIAMKLIEERDNYNIILTNRLEHIDILSELLKSVGYESEILIGDTKADERERIIESFKNGEINFLFSNYQLASEGLDLPIANRLHMVLPVRDKRTTIQSAGRVERLHPKKIDAIVYDYVDINIGNLVGMYHDRRRHLNAR